jgi:hypothetical protein
MAAGPGVYLGISFEIYHLHLRLIVELYEENKITGGVR